MAEHGPNFSKYFYAEWPVRLPEHPERTPVHVGRGVNGIDTWTSLDVSPKWLGWARQLLSEGQPDPEWQKQLERIWLQHYREAASHA